MALRMYQYFQFVVTVYTNAIECAFHINFDEELLGKMLE